jgi:hypothetical protein
MYESVILLAFLAMLFSPCLVAAPDDAVVSADVAGETTRPPAVRRAVVLRHSRPQRWTGYPEPAQVRRRRNLSEA